MISDSVVCATSKDLDQPAHMRSLVRAFAYRMNFCDCLAAVWASFGVSVPGGWGLCGFVWVCACREATLLEITCHCSSIIPSFCTLVP